MNKDIKKASTMIEEKENERNRLISEAEKELKEATTKRDKLKSELDNSKTAEEYKTALQQIRDYEATIDFCQKKVNKVKTETITPADYKIIKTAILTEFEEIQTKTKEETEKTIKLLLEQMTAYETKTLELNVLLGRARLLANRSVCTDKDLNIQSIINRLDTYNVNNYFYDAYFKLGNIKAILPKNINPWEV